MDNINISFAADKSANNEKRLNDIENFISLLADRIKFCLADINDDVAAKSDGEEEKQLIYQVLSDGVGEFTNSDKNCEIFNDYENNVASAYFSHAEGSCTTASAPYSHAEGNDTVASNIRTHAEGWQTTASGANSHAENMGCIASGSNSHAEGYYTMATGEHSHASGSHTVAGLEVFALGKYNKTADDVLLVVGNGWGTGSNEYRSDALVLDTMGNLHIAGKFIADGGVDGVGYTLPAATRNSLGGVMIGDNLLVSESGIIAADLSECVKSDEIADWAKAESKPLYTAEEVGAAAKTHTHTADEIGAAAKMHMHTKSDITDFPTLGTAAGKNVDYFAEAGHTHTAAEVGAATAADITAAVNAVGIGGRNIVTGTAEAVIGSGGHSKGHWRKYGTTGTIQTVDIADPPISCVGKGLRLTSTDESSQIALGQDEIPLNSGKIYTFSCWIRSNSAAGVPCRLQPFYRSANDHSGGSEDIYPTEEWQYISFTAKFTPQSSEAYSGARIYLRPTAAGNYIEVCAMKMEAGNKPTDWSPAPEDAERRITALEARVAALEAAAVSGGEV